MPVFQETLGSLFQMVSYKTNLYKLSPSSSALRKSQTLAISISNFSTKSCAAFSCKKQLTKEL